jgi:hypothetical protein
MGQWEDVCVVVTKRSKLKAELPSWGSAIGRRGISDAHEAEVQLRQTANQVRGVLAFGVEVVLGDGTWRRFS